jgi:hypothetical protein
MVLLENFGACLPAGPFTVKLDRSNRNNFVCLLARKVIQTLMVRIPKLRKENHPERAKNEKGPIFSRLLRDYLTIGGVWRGRVK